MKNGNHKFTVSAVISVYNGEQFIGRCLKSILNQRHAFDEIIVYDDASQDDTVSIIKKFMDKDRNSKIKLIQSDVNRGPGGGKNYARKAVTKEYFTFIDADDYVSERYLDFFLHALKNLPYSPDILFSGFKKTDNVGNILYIRVFDSKEKALIGNVQNWGNLYKYSFFEKNNIDIPEGKVLDDVLTRGVMIGYAPLTAVVRRGSEYYYVENKSSVSHTYMKSFIPGVIDIEMEYLKNNKARILPAQYAIYEYWAYKTICWHLLKSGTGVGNELMEVEADRAFKLLKQYFPEYKKNLYIAKRAPKGERIPVRIAIKGMYILEKLNLHKKFLRIYANINFESIWPKL